jgi:hypothetical protein
MSKHTPGPWIARRTAAGWSGTRGWAIDFNEDQEQVVDFVYEEADARLIAAAPELLEALHGVVRRCEGMGYVGVDGQYLKVVRAAIAKAGGEQP